MKRSAMRDGPPGLRFASSGLQRCAMSDLNSLEDKLTADIAAAGDEGALEAVRIAALGKSGSVSALLKTLGGMTPDERKQQGPLINGLQAPLSGAIAARRETLQATTADQRRHTQTLSINPAR